MLVAGLKVCCEGRSQCIETINRELWQVGEPIQSWFSQSGRECLAHDDIISLVKPVLIRVHGHILVGVRAIIITYYRSFLLLRKGFSIIPSMKGCLRLLLSVEKLLVTPLVFGIGLYSLSSLVSLTPSPLDRILALRAQHHQPLFLFPWLAFELQSSSSTLLFLLSGYLFPQHPASYSQRIFIASSLAIQGQRVYQLRAQPLLLIPLCSQQTPSLLLPFKIYVGPSVGANCSCKTEVYLVKSPKML